MRPLISVLLFLFSLSINAAQVNRVIRGSATMEGTNLRAYLCDTIDLNSSVLFFSMTADDATTSRVLVAGRLVDNQTIEFVRDANGSYAKIEYQVVEFSSGVSVQRGIANINNTTTNVTINSVNTSRSFAIATLYNNGAELGSDDGVTADITTATNLQFRCNADGFDVFWQVVEYDSCSVQKVSAALNGTTSATSTISAVNTSKTMLISNHRQSGGINADDVPRTELTNSTTVTYTRNGSARDLNYVTYVIEFTDNTTVQRSSTSFASGDLVLNDTLNAVNFSTSLVNCPGNFGRQGSSNYTTTDNMGYVWFQYRLLNDSVVQIERDNTGATATATTELVEFSFTASTTFDDSDPAGPYDDAQVKSIQRGSTNIANGASITNITINAVDLSKSILIFESSTNAADPNDNNITGTLSSSTNIRFERTGTGAQSDITYKVIEFFGTISVQRGSTTLNNTTVNQSITSVNLKKAFVLLTLRGTGNTLGDNDFAVGDLTTPTNLQFRTYATGAIVEWQVVEYDDAHVRKVRSAIPDGTTSVSIDINPCGTNYVNAGKTMIVGGHTTEDNVNADDLPRFELADSTSIDVTRVGSNSNMDILIYVVEFLDSTTVQNGTTDLAGGATTGNQGISSVDTSKSIAISTGNNMRQGSTTYASTDISGYASFGLILNSPTNLAVSRRVGGTSLGTAAWQVVRFKRGEEPLPIELLYFEASLLNEKDVELNWATASEQNVSHFEIEKAHNNFDFRKIALIQAEGESNSFHEYSANTELEEDGIYYFRIKSVDFDGSYEYSDIQSVELFSSRESNYAVYPNPFKDYLVFENRAEEPLKLKMRNAQGLILQSFDIGPYQSNRLPFDLTPGSYTLEVSSEHFLETKVLIKL